MSMTVSGAYGRDYKSKKAMQEDWDAGKDFINRGIEGGTYVNKADAERHSLQVWGRYKNDTMICQLR